METPKPTKMNYLLDLRQSESWAEYLKTVGWRSVRTSNNTNIEFRKFPLGSLVKIQRPKNLNKKELDEIEKICRENKALFTKIEPSLNQKISILKDNNFFKSNFPLLPPSTIFIDLTKPEKELWDSISRSGKYSINRAQRERAKVEFFQKPNDVKLREFSEIAQSTSKKKRFYFEGLKDLKKKVDIFKDQSYLSLVYNEDGDLSGGNFYLGFKKNVWFLHGGTSEIGRKSKDGYELYWKSFLYLKNKGYQTLDLEGKDDGRFPSFTKNWGGFSHFKEKFGGKPIEYPEPHVKLLHPTLKTLHKFYPMMPI